LILCALARGDARPRTDRRIFLGASASRSRSSLLFSGIGCVPRQLMLRGAFRHLGVRELGLAAIGFIHCCGRCSFQSSSVVWRNCDRLRQRDSHFQRCRGISSGMLKSPFDPGIPSRVTKASASIAVVLLISSQAPPSASCLLATMASGGRGESWTPGDAGTRAGRAAPRTCCTGPSNRRRQS